MADRPHSLLVEHQAVPKPRTHGEALHGHAAGCLACEEHDASYETEETTDA